MPLLHFCFENLSEPQRAGLRFAQNREDGITNGDWLRYGSAAPISRLRRAWRRGGGGRLLPRIRERRRPWGRIALLPASGCGRARMPDPSRIDKGDWW